MLIIKTSENAPVTHGSSSLNLSVGIADGIVIYKPNAQLEFAKNAKDCTLIISALESCYITSFKLSPSLTVKTKPELDGQGSFPAKTKHASIIFDFTTENSDQTELTLSVQARGGGKIFSNDPQVGNDPIVHPGPP